jgi:hypothetical protein
MSQILLQITMAFRRSFLFPQVFLDFVNATSSLGISNLFWSRVIAAVSCLVHETLSNVPVCPTGGISLSMARRTNIPFARIALNGHTARKVKIKQVAKWAAQVQYCISGFVGMSLGIDLNIGFCFPILGQCFFDPSMYSLIK